MVLETIVFWLNAQNAVLEGKKSIKYSMINSVIYYGRQYS